jgi:hypothetical protein
MNLTEYTVADLRGRLRPGCWFDGSPAPLTKQRAWSQVANPRAESGDVALLVAADGDQVVAHLGVLPDKTFANGHEQKIGWLTAWWANPDRKYAGIGLALLVRAYSLYQGRLGASGFSKDTKKVCETIKKFVTIQELHGFSGFARLNLHKLMKNRSSGLAKYKTSLKTLDLAADLWGSLRRTSWRKRYPLPEAVRLEYVPEFDEEADDFIQHHSKANLVKRGARELNWIARYPWEQFAPLGAAPDFRFTSPVGSLSVLKLKVYGPDDRITAVLLLNVIDHHVTVPYCFYSCEAALIARLLCHFVSAQHAERLTIYQEPLVAQIRALGFPWLKVLDRQRSWIWSKVCAESCTTAYQMQDGDGDCAFTL